jgi:hypothetical protein
VEKAGWSTSTAVNKCSKVLIVQIDDVAAAILGSVAASCSEQILILYTAAHQEASLPALWREPAAQLVELWIRWIALVILAFDIDIRRRIVLGQPRKEPGCRCVGVRNVDPFSAVVDPRLWFWLYKGGLLSPCDGRGSICRRKMKEFRRSVLKIPPQLDLGLRST